MMELVAAAGTKAKRTETAGRWGLPLDLIAVAFLAALPAAFFWRFLWPDAGFVASLPSGDFTDLHYPYRLFETRELLLGRLPLWNPYVYGGESALGDIQHGIFYPLNVVFSLLLGRDGYVPFDLILQIVAHFSLAGIFTYLFARRVLSSRAAAIVGATVFAYGSYLTSFPVQQIIILETSVWLPLILLFIDIGFDKRSNLSFVAAGIFAAVAISVGHPQTFAYVFAAALAYSGLKVWLARDSNEKLGGKEARRIGVRTVVSGLSLFVLMTFGIAAVQLIPSYEHLQLTQRTAVSFDFVQQGFRLRELIGLLFPTSSGGRYMYVGVLPLLLAVVGFFSQIDARQKGFWLVVGCLALIFSFGGQTFLYAAAYLLVPGFKFFRDQERMVFLFAFALAVLAGYGVKAIGDEVIGADFLGNARRQLARTLNWLGWSAMAIATFCLVSFLIYVSATGDQRAQLSELSDRANLTLLVFVASLSVLHLSSHRRMTLPLFATLVVGIIVFELFSTNWRNNLQLVKPDALFPMTNTVKKISADKSEAFRIFSEGLLPGDGNAGAIYELEDIVGNSPLETQAHQKFESGIDEIRRWQLLNVKYVVTKRKLSDGRLIPTLQEGDINTYELVSNLRLPRAFMVYKVNVATSPDEELRLANAIEPRSEVVLQKVPPLALPQTAPPDTMVTIVQRQAGRMDLKTSSAENGLLVLSETFYPGWQAFVDGRPVEVLRANYLLQAVPLEKGARSVEFVYAPAGLKTGLIVSLLSAALAIVVVVASGTRFLLSARGRRRIE
ncbi:MAG: YfhO family protein [Chloroflexi bacterium]|nr:YfhO family protein [Chloroflexota bacterium]